MVLPPGTPPLGYASRATAWHYHNCWTPEHGGGFRAIPHSKLTSFTLPELGGLVPELGRASEGPMDVSPTNLGEREAASLGGCAGRRNIDSLAVIQTKKLYDVRVHGSWKHHPSHSTPPPSACHSPAALPPPLLRGWVLFSIIMKEENTQHCIGLKWDPRESQANFCWTKEKRE